MISEERAGFEPAHMKLGSTKAHLKRAAFDETQDLRSWGHRRADVEVALCHGTIERCSEFGLPQLLLVELHARARRGVLGVRRAYLGFENIDSRFQR